MANQNHPICTLPLKLTATVVQKTFVDLDGDTATAAAYAFGVADMDGVSGETIAVVVQGTAKVLSAAAIAKGAAVEVGAAGKAATLAAGVKVGRALEAAGGANEVIEVLLIPN
jgi:hypothetical protein